MSMTKSQIEMDFSRAIAQAEELEEISKELSNIASAHIKGAFSLLSGSWKGENSAEYLERGNLLTEDMFGTADDLIKVAKNIRSTAKIVYNAEQAALQLSY